MSLDNTFEKLVDDIRTTQGEVADGVAGTSARPWMDFRSIKEFGKFEISLMRTVFSRTSIDTIYNQARSEASTLSKTLQAVKLMGDFLAGAERDWRMRQRSRVRMFVHGACIARANGTKSGPLQRNTIHWLTRVLSEDGS
jgi:hypothetical protein